MNQFDFPIFDKPLDVVATESNAGNPNYMAIAATPITPDPPPNLQNKHPKLNTKLPQSILKLLTVNIYIQTLGKESPQGPNPRINFKGPRGNSENVFL